MPAKVKKEQPKTIQDPLRDALQRAAAETDDTLVADWFRQLAGNRSAVGTGTVGVEPVQRQREAGIISH